MLLAVSLASMLYLATDPTPEAASAKALPTSPRSTAFQQSGASAPGTGKKKKVIRLEAITVEGRIQKPQAFYILQRSNLNFEELNRSTSLVPKVVQSVEKEPF